jgi:hypothetical protein
MSSIQEKATASILSVIRARRKSASALPIDLSLQSPGVLPRAAIREASFSDFPAVAALKQRGGLVADSFENWERLWRDNPALTQCERKPPIGWVLEADGVVVGYLGNISLSYHYAGRTLTAVTGHGLVVDPIYRAYAVSLVSAFYRQKFVDLYLGTSAIPEVGKIARALKCDDVPQADYATVLFWVLRPHSFTQDLFERLRIKPGLAALTVAPASIAIGIDRLFNRRFPRRGPAGLDLSEITIGEIGNEFESLWVEKLREDSRVLADRSPAVLRWHFEIPGDKGSARVLCCRRNGKLLGYAVVRNDPQPSGRQKSVIADILVLKDDAEVVKTLLLAAYNHAKIGGSYILELTGFPSSIRRACSLSNPYTRKYPGCPFHYKAADRNLHEVLSDGAAWYASPFDGDATLIRPSFSASVSLSPMETQSPANQVCV